MDRRYKFRQGLCPPYAVKYDKLCDVLPPPWQPYQGYRTFAQQDKLYAMGRTESGVRVTNAAGGLSAHNWGAATDWTLFDVNGHPVWLEADDPAWLEYNAALKECGLRPGSEFNDVNHNELRLKCRWGDILEVYRKGGMDAAQSMLIRMAVLQGVV